MSETLHLEAPIFTDSGMVETADVGGTTFDFNSLGSEAANAETNTEKQDNESDGSNAEDDGSNQEAGNDNWDAQLTLYVSANANQPVVMDGIEMTLSEAMFLFPVITKENVDSILAQAKRMVDEAESKKNEMLDEPESEAEEIQSEETPKAEDNPAKIKNDGKKNSDKNEKPRIQEKLIKIDAQIPAVESIARVEYHPRPPKVIEITAAPQDSNPAVKAAAPANPAKISKIVPASDGAPEAADTISGLADGPALEPAVGDAKHDYEFAVDAAAASPTVEIELAIDGPQIIAGQDYESLAPSQELEPAGEAVGPELLDMEYSPISRTIAEFEEPAIAEDGQGLAIINNRAGIDAPDDFIKAQVTIDSYEGIAWEADRLYALAETPAPEIGGYNLGEAGDLLPPRPNIESGFAEPPADASGERFIPDSSAITRAEHVLTELSDQFNVLAPQAIDEVNEILETIVEISMTAEIDIGETMAKADAQAELEELFTGLLSGLGIDYTPELVESLARLTLDWRLAERIEIMKDENQPNQAPPDSGTHEIIKKLLAALGAIKKALARASTIGKSALQLCAFSYAV